MELLPGSLYEGKGVSHFFDGSAARPSSPPLAAPQIFPPSLAQETMLFWDKLVPHSAVYNVPIAFTLQGSLDRQALADSFDLIISRHQVLRSSFRVDHGEPSVVVLPQRQTALSFLELSHLSRSEKATTVEEAVNAEARRPFQLVKDLMLRAALLRLSPSDHLLILTMHHIAADGWSGGVLVKELSQAYLALAGKAVLFCEGVNLN